MHATFLSQKYQIQIHLLKSLWVIVLAILGDKAWDVPRIISLAKQNSHLRF